MFTFLRRFSTSNNKHMKHFSTTVDVAEIQKFQTFSQWWDPFGDAMALHSMNKLRIPFIRDGLINAGAITEENISTQPLTGIKILDIGCGAGILSEPLARIGGIITGVDANPEVLEEAKYHSQQEGLSIHYENGTIEEHACSNAGKYDAVVASEILEHVNSQEEFVKACVQCLKPSGSIFISTFSKTAVANLFGIHVAENILKVIPKGTHDIDKFIAPHNLQRILMENNCKTQLLHGMMYNPFTNEWKWCSNTSINYFIHAIKLPQ